MAKKHKHEEHTNHEAWAIPYGDLVTLLLAFFVVMYAVSSVNEGKYKVLAEALSESFGGTPKSMQPIQLGKLQQRGSKTEQTSPLKLSKAQPAIAGNQRDLQNPAVFAPISTAANQQLNASGNTGYARSKAELTAMSSAIEKALGPMIDRQLIRLRRTELSLEIEMNTDILFGSGSARASAASLPALNTLAGILKPFSQPLRIEGHTDNLPIHTATFPSNWELSSARAASVVHLFMEQGVAPERMTVAGLGEYQPAASNEAPEGRNRNRRVVVVVLARPDAELAAAAPAAAMSGPAQAAAAGPEKVSFPAVVVPAGTLRSLETSPETGEERHG